MYPRRWVIDLVAEDKNKILLFIQSQFKPNFFTVIVWSDVKCFIYKINTDSKQKFVPRKIRAARRVSFIHTCEPLKKSVAKIRLRSRGSHTEWEVTMEDPLWLNDGFWLNTSCLQTVLFWKFELTLYWLCNKPVFTFTCLIFLPRLCLWCF